jgi:lipoprotein NlpI
MRKPYSRSLLAGATLLIFGPTAFAQAAGLDEANAGLLAARRGQYDEAIRHFSAALAAGDLSPENVMLAHHNRGNAYQDKGDYAHAIAEYDLAIKLAPDYAESYYARGRAQFALGEFAEASTDFARSVMRDPSDPYAVLWLHLSRLRAPQADTAELTRNAARLDLKSWPGSLIALYLGKASPEQMRAEAARTDIGSGQDRACEAAFYLGEYERSRRNVPAARALFQQALKICPFTTDEYDGAQVELKRLP